MRRGGWLLAVTVMVGIVLMLTPDDGGPQLPWLLAGGVAVALMVVWIVWIDV